MFLINILKKLKRLEWVNLNYNQIKIIKLVLEIRRERTLLLSNIEVIQLYNLLESTNSIIGDIAEIGVYQGASAKIICEASKNKRVYLFDTFEGLPDDSKDGFKKKQFSETYDKVVKYLEPYNTVICKGYFPNTAKIVQNNKFSFVHLDVDLYQSTIEGLKFFYPRLNNGGIILTHDYNILSVVKAFEDYFKGTVPIIKLLDKQAFVMKGPINELIKER